MNFLKDGKLETLMESNKANLNIRTLASEDSLNSLKLYFKSILNYKPAKIIKNDYLTNNNNNAFNNANRRRFPNAKRSLDKLSYFI